MLPTPGGEGGRCYLEYYILILVYCSCSARLTLVYILSGYHLNGDSCGFVPLSLNAKSVGVLSGIAFGPEVRALN